MEMLTRLLRAKLMLDTAVGAFIAVPIFLTLAVGCLLSGNFIAAITFAVYPVAVGLIYPRYWRRFPLQSE